MKRFIYLLVLLLVISCSKKELNINNNYLEYNNVRYSLSYGAITYNIHTSQHFSDTTFGISLFSVKIETKKVGDEIIILNGDEVRGCQGITVDIDFKAPLKEKTYHILPNHGEVIKDFDPESDISGDQIKYGLLSVKKDGDIYELSWEGFTQKEFEYTVYYKGRLDEFWHTIYY